TSLVSPLHSGQGAAEEPAGFRTRWQPAAPSTGPCSESDASGGELAGRGGGGRGEKRKEAPGASETKRVRPGTWENRFIIGRNFPLIYIRRYP
ncbi:hypothetical protein INR49_013019, partial [Caranx melampygus]